MNFKVRMEASRIKFETKNIFTRIYLAQGNKEN